MAREILGEFGPERTTGPHSPNGGHITPRDVRNYQPPKGPTSIHDHGPGLHGDVHKSGSQGHHGGEGHDIGKPGIGGTIHPCGSQR